MGLFSKRINKQEEQRQADLQNKFEAISRSQAVIEFGLDGTIVGANENCCGAMGYAAG